MVNEAFVRIHLQGRSPIGLRLAMQPAANARAKVVEREVVGVVRQVKGRPDESEDLVQIYVPLRQDLDDDLFLLVRPESGGADELASAVRAAIGRVDKEQLVSVRDLMTLEDVAWEATARHRFRAAMVVSFACLALVLAMVGLFGVLSYGVQQRVRDFGVRRALGASSGDVFRPIVTSAIRLTATGIVGGLLLATFTSRLLSTMLFGIEPLDPLTFVIVTVVLALTAVVAVAGPAWKASRVDPVVALRAD
jgi:putative ABC transport system permease protein